MIGEKSGRETVSFLGIPTQRLAAKVRQIEARFRGELYGGKLWRLGVISSHWLGLVVGCGLFRPAATVVSSHWWGLVWGCGLFRAAATRFR